MRRYRLLTACTMVSLMGAVVSCETRPAQDRIPKHEAAWTGRPGNLASSGHGKNFIYGTLWRPDLEEKRLVLWRWQGDLIKEVSTSVLPRSRGAVPVNDDICGLTLGRKKGPWPFALMELDGNTILKKWETLPGWMVWGVGVSMNGKFVVLVKTDSATAPDYEFGKQRTSVSLIDVARRELRVVIELQGHGAGTIRTVVVTDDGRYIAVAGWNNGTAMVDAKEGTLLWAKRPQHEISTGYAAFAPDGKLIYTAGSEGCVYGIEVATGNVANQRWATTTGKSNYAHRVSSLAVSSDGKWLAAGTGPEGEVYVWNLEGDKKPRALRHGRGVIDIVAFSPDAKNIVSVGAGALKVWQLE